MTARRKVAARRTTSRKGTRKTGRRKTRRVSKNRLAPDLPTNLAELWDQMRRLLREIEGQIDKARAVQEARWRRGEERTRAELLKLVRRLERALKTEPRRAAPKRTAARKKAASRKKVARKKTSARKKVSRKKAASRKKTSRR
jgi:hypothetical protein